MKYGYRRRGKDESPEIIEAEAAIVRRMYGEAAAGKSQHHITCDLNREGILTQEGKRWEQGTVARMLRDSTYKGRLAIKGEIVFDGPWRIVSDELWDRVAVLRSARDKAPGKGRGRRTAGMHLLTGSMLRCSCGGPLSPRTYRPSGTEVYVCRTHYYEPHRCQQKPIPRERIDSAGEPLLWRELRRPEPIECTFRPIELGVDGVRPL